MRKEIIFSIIFGVIIGMSGLFVSIYLSNSNKSYEKVSAKTDPINTPNTTNDKEVDILYPKDQYTFSLDTPTLKISTKLDYLIISDLTGDTFIKSNNSEVVKNIENTGYLTYFNIFFKGQRKDSLKLLTMPAAKELAVVSGAINDLAENYFQITTNDNQILQIDLKNSKFKKKQKGTYLDIYKNELALGDYVFVSISKDDKNIIAETVLVETLVFPELIFSVGTLNTFTKDGISLSEDGENVKVSLDRQSKYVGIDKSLVVRKRTKLIQFDLKSKIVVVSQKTDKGPVARTIFLFDK